MRFDFDLLGLDSPGWFLPFASVLIWNLPFPIPDLFGSRLFLIHLPAFSWYYRWFVLQLQLLSLQSLINVFCFRHSLIPFVPSLRQYLVIEPPIRATHLYLCIVSTLCLLRGIQHLQNNLIHFLWDIFFDHWKRCSPTDLSTLSTILLPTFDFRHVVDFTLRTHSFAHRLQHDFITIAYSHFMLARFLVSTAFRLQQIRPSLAKDYDYCLTFQLDTIRPLLFSK